MVLNLEVGFRDHRNHKDHEDHKEENGELCDLCGSYLAVASGAWSALIRLPDAEVEPPPPLLRLSVDDEARDRIQLIADIEADRTDRCLVAQTRPDGIAKIAEREAARLLPYVAAVEKQNAAQIPAQHGTDFLAERQHAVAANRQPFGQRADFVASPAADAGGAAEEVLLGKRHRQLVLAERPDVSELEPARQHQRLAGDGQVVTGGDRGGVIVERSRHEPPGLLRVKGDLIAAMRVQQVVRGRMLKVKP